MLSTPPDQQLAAEHRVTTSFFIVEPRRAQLDLLARLVTEGRLRSVVAQTYPLSEGRRAYELGNPEHRPGKTVLVVR
jgi:NADPH:quinone reductase-like Zn-dependent oxidoreductase